MLFASLLLQRYNVYNIDVYDIVIIIVNFYFLNV